MLLSFKTGGSRTAPTYFEVACIHQQGVVLATMLLYLTILTLLVATALSISALQTKISQQYLQTTQTFEKTEAALTLAELAIRSGQQQGEGIIDAQTRYQFTKLTPTHTCADDYLVTAVSLSATSKISLESIWQLPNTDEEGCLIDTVIAHRIVWRQTDE